MLIPSFIHTQDIIYNIYIFGDLKKLVDGDVILSGVGKVQSIASRKSWSPSYLSSRAIHNHKVHTVTVTQIIFTSFYQVSRSYTCHVHSSLLLQQTPADFLGRHDETHHIAENYFSDQYSILIRTSIVEAKCQMLSLEHRFRYLKYLLKEPFYYCLYVHVYNVFFGGGGYIHTHLIMLVSLCFLCMIIDMKLCLICSLYALIFFYDYVFCFSLRTC